MTGALATSTREKTAARLLNSSAKNSYDPEIDIDWEAPLVDGMYFLPEQRISLYGTPMWDRMTPEQRIELSRQEVASIASAGIWFEMILMQMLLRDTYSVDPTRKHPQWALTEIGDECRHSVMFARLIERIGVPAYPAPRLTHELGRVIKTVGFGPSNYAAILVAEEILDRFQREGMKDESVQPLVRMVSRIHVLEEARHVTFAREEIARQMQRAKAPARAWHQFISGASAQVIARTLVRPQCYQAVGLDPVQARREARHSPQFQETLRWAGERLVGFLDEVGLTKGPGRFLWKRSGLLG
ncbi:diiron oxygenase [Fodinicola feengrottensis]|uniref:Diiron oxygenase n=1 Tax=Fodinicola feengrottensis TaxID=435914 RepID=A0ABP4U4W5_9ACTN